MTKLHVLSATQKQIISLLKDWLSNNSNLGRRVSTQTIYNEFKKHYKGFAHVSPRGFGKSLKSLKKNDLLKEIVIENELKSNTNYYIFRKKNKSNEIYLNTVASIELLEENLSSLKANLCTNLY